MRAARRCHAPRLFHNEGDRRRFVQQPGDDLLVTRPPVGWIEEDAATSQNAVRFGDKRGNPAHVEIGAAETVLTVETIVDIDAHRRFPMTVVRGVDGVLARAVTEAHSRPGQAEFPRARIKREDVDTVTERKNQRRLRPIDEKACRELTIAGAAERPDGGRTNRIGREN